MRSKRRHFHRNNCELDLKEQLDWKKSIRIYFTNEYLAIWIMNLWTWTNHVQLIWYPLFHVMGKHSPQNSNHEEDRLREKKINSYSLVWWFLFHLRTVSLLGVIDLVRTPGTACSSSIGRTTWISSQTIRCFSDLRRKFLGFSIKDIQQFDYSNEKNE